MQVVHIVMVMNKWTSGFGVPLAVFTDRAEAQKVVSSMNDEVKDRDPEIWGAYLLSGPTNTVLGTIYDVGSPLAETSIR